MLRAGWQYLSNSLRACRIHPYTMFGQRDISGVWGGEYTYDILEYQHAADTFTWTIKQGRRGRFAGSSIDQLGRRPAGLDARVRGARVRVLKVYDADPDRLYVLNTDGRTITATEYFSTPEWREYLESLAHAHGEQFPSDTISVERLARDAARASHRLEYEGRLVSADRMEGRWRIPESTLAWAQLPMPETSGVWRAERQG